ncbi:hypothetical protein LCGC14_0911070 [marine sediment metagenome]|uniref:Uncharacterized protein n=1 Tax=marine sediment metagenome TaxID=412755 RepID=A0A0F9RCK9_9ZZZZ|nr:hypothetical protein [Candidatus Aminicenantes bacterium]
MLTTDEYFRGVAELKEEAFIIVELLTAIKVLLENPLLRVPPVTLDMIFDPPIVKKEEKP